jgi:hypothetical protein
LGVENDVVYFNDLELASLSKNINPCRPRGYSSQTVMKALAISIFMGYDKIYLLGVDNSECKSLFGDSRNNLWVRTDNYYASSSLKSFDYQVFTPSGADGAFAQYATWFSDFKKFAKGNVFNLDLDSLVDAFPKTKHIGD